MGTNMNQKTNQNMAKKYHQILNMNLMLNNLILIQTARDFDVSQILRNILFAFIKVEFFLKSSLDSIPSPSLSSQIQIMGGKVCLRCKGNTLLGVVNKLFVFKSLLTSPSNVLRYHLK